MSTVFSFEREGPKYLLIDSNVPEDILNLITPRGDMYFRGYEISEGNIYGRKEHLKLNSKTSKILNEANLEPDFIIRIERNVSDTVHPFKILEEDEVKKILDVDTVLLQL